VLLLALIALTHYATNTLMAVWRNAIAALANPSRTATGGRQLS